MILFFAVKTVSKTVGKKNSVKKWCKKKLVNYYLTNKADRAGKKKIMVRILAYKINSALPFKVLASDWQQKE